MLTHEKTIYSRRLSCPRADYHNCVLLQKEIRVAASLFINASFNEYQYLIQYTFHAYFDGIATSI